MRRRVLLLVAATASLVLVAFLVPLALLVRTVAAERAVLAATADAQALTALVAVADPLPSPWRSPRSTRRPPPR